MSPQSTKSAEQKGLRAWIYIRQSTFKEESISSELQETACRDHAAKHGYTVIKVVEDIGVSGRTFKRPGITTVMAAIAAGEADIVIVWKWSRVSRSRLDWAVAADKVESSGGRIESATEAIDVSTSTGRLARGMMTEFAAFESERIGDVWKESHARRIKNGLPATGKPRFGYTYDREKGFTPDPVNGPVLAEMYRRYNSGLSIYSLVAWANAGPSQPSTGYVRHHDGLWKSNTIRNMLDSGFGAGYIRHKGALLKGAHEAVIEPGEWDEYLSRREVRGPVKQVERSPYLLGGLVRCWCGAGMAGSSGNDRGRARRRFTCNAVRHKQAHRGGTLSMDNAEKSVLAWLEALADEINAAAKEVKVVKAPVTNKAATLRRELIRCETRLDKLTNGFLDGTIPASTYERLRDDLAAKKAAVEVALRGSEVAVRHPVAEVVPDLLLQWDRLELSVRRDILKRLIARVEMVKDEPLRIVPAWDY